MTVALATNKALPFPGRLGGEQTGTRARPIDLARELIFAPNAVL